METHQRRFEVRTYEFRLDFEDGYEIVQEDAFNYGAAKRRIMERYPDAQYATLLGTIDSEPQVALAFDAA